MTKLSDTQVIILSAACSRLDRMVLPLPRSLKGGAATKVIASLIAKGLVQEVEANVVRGDLVWRETSDGPGVTLVATEVADAAIDGDSTAGVEAAAAPQRASKAKTPKVAPKPQAKARKAPKPTAAATLGKTRDGTKQAQLIAMLKRAKGASITEIADAFGWQHHTVRGALAGALKKKLGLTIVSEKNDRRGRV